MTYRMMFYQDPVRTSLLNTEVEPVTRPSKLEWSALGHSQWISLVVAA